MSVPSPEVPSVLAVDKGILDWFTKTKPGQTVLAHLGRVEQHYESQLRTATDQAQMLRAQGGLEALQKLGDLIHEARDRVEFLRETERQRLRAQAAATVATREEQRERRAPSRGGPDRRRPSAGLATQGLKRNDRAEVT